MTVFLNRHQGFRSISDTALNLKVNQEAILHYYDSLRNCENKLTDVRRKPIMHIDTLLYVCVYIYIRIYIYIYIRVCSLL